MSHLSAPNISVVIPLYNKEQSVIRCVASVQRQTCPPAEIIIVNDGSTDKSLAVVQTIPDPRIRIIDQPNGGVSSARNLGISRARHEFIALLDADDEWDPVFLETMLTLIRKFPEAGLYYSSHINKHGPNRVQSTVARSLPIGYQGFVNFFQLNTEEGPWSSACVIRQSFLARTGLFDPKLVKGEDIDLWIRFALNGPIILHNAPLSTCHLDAENRAMEKRSDPQKSLVANLVRYEAAAANHLELRRYLQQMRLGHLSNFLGGRFCELVDGHGEIDRLDSGSLPPVWRMIQLSPRFLRGIVFRLHIHGRRFVRYLTGRSVS